MRKKSVDEVWRDIVEGKCKPDSAVDEMMTLEDFLVQAGAVDDSQLGGELKVESGGVFAFDGPIYLAASGSGIIGFEDGVQVMGVSGRVVRGKRRVGVLEPSVDKAAQQRQRRMIKNRESAARSRERKQAYQVELETMAMRLEEENEMLLKEKGERTKERFRQLMQNVIPVVEKKRPAHFLRRVRSMEL